MIKKVEGVQNLYKRDLIYYMSDIKKVLDKININIYLLDTGRNRKIKDDIEYYLKYSISNKKYIENTLLEDLIKNAPIEKSLELSKKILKLSLLTLKDIYTVSDYFRKNNLKERFINQIELKKINEEILQTYLKIDRIDRANKFFMECYKQGGYKLWV